MNTRTRYFHFTDDPIKYKRVIVFQQGRDGGISYWDNGIGGEYSGLNWWTLSEMKTPESKTLEISRAEALRIVKHLP